MATTHQNESLLDKVGNILPAIEGAAPLGTLDPSTDHAPPPADPDMQQVLNALVTLGGKPIETLTPEEARQQPTPADAVKLRTKGKGECSLKRPNIQQSD